MAEETDHPRALQKGKNLGLRWDWKKVKWLGLLLEIQWVSCLDHQMVWQKGFHWDLKKVKWLGLL